MMNQLEKKEMVRIVGEALEDIVLPELYGIKEDVSILKEDVKDLKLTTYRIETKLNAEVLRLDEHSIEMGHLKQRVSRLESRS